MPDMTLMHPLLFLAGVLLVMFGVAGWLGRRLGAASRPAPVVESAAATRAVELEVTLEGVRERVRQLEAEVAEEKRKRMETVGIICDVQKERNQYRDLWWACAMEHSAAQHFMAEKHSQLVKICKRHGIDPREDERVAKLAKDYAQKHSEEKRVEMRERIESERTAEHAAIEAPAVAEGRDSV